MALTEKDLQRAELERQKLEQKTIINRACHIIEQINKRIRELEQGEQLTAVAEGSNHEVSY